MSNRGFGHRVQTSTSLRAWMFFLLIIVNFKISNAQSGLLDNSFANNGILTFTLNPLYTYVRGLLIKPDGKILVLGHFPDPGNMYSINYVVSYKSNGSVDSTWGNNGIVTNTDVVGTSLAIQSDGKIVVAGGGTDFRVIRYLPDGTIDQGFGINGLVITKLTTSDDHARCVSIQTDGKILVGGESFDGKFELVRYNSNGSTDSNFGFGGLVITPIQNATALTCRDMKIQSDGKILLGGRSNNFLLVRYNTDGSLDNNFGNAGVVTNTLGSGESLGQQTDGRIVMGGITSGPSCALIRFNTNGTNDNTYGNNGISVITPSLRTEAIILQPDNKISVVGYTATPGAGSVMLARYNADGTLDGSFGNNGTTLTAITGNDDAYYGQLTPDGKILIAGESTDNVNWNVYGFLARYNSGLQIGFKENTKDISEFSVYPNPFDGKIRISQQDDKPLRIMVLNNLAEVIYECNSNCSPIDLGFLPPGIYILRAMQDQQSYSRKLIKR